MTKDQKFVKKMFVARLLSSLISYAHRLPVHLSTSHFVDLSIACHFTWKEHNKCANKIDIYDEIKRNGSQYDKHFSIHVYYTASRATHQQRQIFDLVRSPSVFKGKTHTQTDVFFGSFSLFFFFLLKISNCSICIFIFLCKQVLPNQVFSARTHTNTHTEIIMGYRKRLIVHLSAAFHQK